MDKSQFPSYTPAQVYQPEQPGPQLYPQLQHPPSQPPPQQSTVIIQTTTSGGAVGSGPTRLRCPSCHAEIVTSVKHTANSRTHCWALVLCLFICWPCVCVPYCMDSCQSANHYCPNCDAFIGTHAN